MRILSISSDRKIFEKGSDIRARSVSFGHMTDEYHIIVFALKGLNLAPEKISEHTWIYPTNSSNKLSYMGDAIKLGLKLGKFDLVTTQDPFESGWTGYRLARKLKTKLHLQIHTDFMSSFFVKGNFLNFIRVGLAKFLLPKADGIRVVSSRIKQSIKDLGLKVVPDILPVFINPKKFQSDSPKINLHEIYPQFNNILLTVSRLEEEKNLELSLSVFRDVLKKHPKTGYIIVGDGSLKKSLESFVKENHLERNIIFLGWKNITTDYYQTADMYLSTSNYEGYGLTLLEAVIANLPVVSTDVGAVGDILVNNTNSLICPVGDKDCILKSVLKLIENKEIRDSFKENNKQIIQNLIPKFEYEYFENYRKSWLKAINM